MTRPSDSVAGDERFPSTRWSLLLESTHDGRTDEALGRLATDYWKPVYAYVRARWAKSHEDAMDCTQDFFAWLIESRLLRRADPGRGRFRTFMKACLNNFLTDVDRKRRTLKRGGGSRPLSLSADEESAPRLEPPDAGGRTADEILDDVWRAELVQRATEQLERELRATGRGPYFDVFRDYFLSESDLDYRAVAERHGITTTDASNYLAYVKKRYRARLKAAVMETVQSADELERELEWLLGGARRG